MSPSQKDIDWTAYEYLQEKILDTEDPFKIKCLDIALDMILDAPTRQAKGIQLANDLYSDAKKQIKIRSRSTNKYALAEAHHYTLYGDGTLPTFPNDAGSDAAGTLGAAIATLSPKETVALTLKIQETDSTKNIAEHLHVGRRQFRNVLIRAQNKLQAYPELYTSISEVLGVSASESQQSELWEVVSKLLFSPATAA